MRHPYHTNRYIPDLSGYIDYTNVDLLKVPAEDPDVSSRYKFNNVWIMVEKELGGIQTYPDLYRIDWRNPG